MSMSLSTLTTTKNNVTILRSKFIVVPVQLKTLNDMRTKCCETKCDRPTTTPSQTSKQQKEPTYDVVMMRHGESEYNQKNLFCGWFNAPLSDKGRQEALSAGKALKTAGRKFDIAYTSVLMRAQDTLATILKELDQTHIPIVKCWRLNERHYGGLTGLDKVETAAKYGDEQVAIWRRSYDVPPPPMDEDHPYHDTIVNDAIYSEGPSASEFPKFESLKMTIERTMPFWNSTIVPEIKSGKRVLIVAHGNSLRGIVKTLDKMDEATIMKLNLPTGIPFVYTLNKNIEPIAGGSLQFIGDPETVKSAMEAVANQAKAK